MLVGEYVLSLSVEQVKEAVVKEQGVLEVAPQALHYSNEVF